MSRPKPAKGKVTSNSDEPDLSDLSFEAEMESEFSSADPAVHNSYLNRKGALLTASSASTSSSSAQSKNTTVAKGSNGSKQNKGTPTKAKSTTSTSFTPSPTTPTASSILARSKAKSSLSLAVASSPDPEPEPEPEPELEFEPDQDQVAAEFMVQYEPAASDPIADEYDIDIAEDLNETQLAPTPMRPKVNAAASVLPLSPTAPTPVAKGKISLKIPTAGQPIQSQYAEQYQTGTVDTRPSDDQYAEADDEFTEATSVVAPGTVREESYSDYMGPFDEESMSVGSFDDSYGDEIYSNGQPLSASAASIAQQRATSSSRKFSTLRLASPPLSPLTRNSLARLDSRTCDHTGISTVCTHCSLLLKQAAQSVDCPLGCDCKVGSKGKTKAHKLVFDRQGRTHLKPKFTSPKKLNNSDDTIDDADEQGHSNNIDESLYDSDSNKNNAGDASSPSKVQFFHTAASDARRIQSIQSQSARDSLRQNELQDRNWLPESAYANGANDRSPSTATSPNKSTKKDPTSPIHPDEFMQSLQGGGLGSDQSSPSSAAVRRSNQSVVSAIAFRDLTAHSYRDSKNLLQPFLSLTDPSKQLQFLARCINGRYSYISVDQWLNAMATPSTAAAVFLQINPLHEVNERFTPVLGHEFTPSFVSFASTSPTSDSESTENGQGNGLFLQIFDESTRLKREKKWRNQFQRKYDRSPTAADVSAAVEAQQFRPKINVEVDEALGVHVEPNQADELPSPTSHLIPCKSRSTALHSLSLFLGKRQQFIALIKDYTEKVQKAGALKDKKRAYDSWLKEEQEKNVAKAKGETRPEPNTSASPPPFTPLSRGELLASLPPLLQPFTLANVHGSQNQHCIDSIFDRFLSDFGQTLVNNTVGSKQALMQNEFTKAIYSAEANAMKQRKIREQRVENRSAYTSLPPDTLPDHLLSWNSNWKAPSPYASQYQQEKIDPDRRVHPFLPLLLENSSSLSQEWSIFSSSSQILPAQTGTTESSTRLSALLGHKLRWYALRHLFSVLGSRHLKYTLCRLELVWSLTSKLNELGLKLKLDLGKNAHPGQQTGSGLLPLSFFKEWIIKKLHMNTNKANDLLASPAIHLVFLNRLPLTTSALSDSNRGVGVLSPSPLTSNGLVRWDGFSSKSRQKEGVSKVEHPPSWMPHQPSSIANTSLQPTTQPPHPFHHLTPSHQDHSQTFKDGRLKQTRKFGEHDSRQVVVGFSIATIQPSLTIPPYNTKGLHLPTRQHITVPALYVWMRGVEVLEEWVSTEASVAMPDSYHKLMDASQSLTFKPKAKGKDSDGKGSVQSSPRKNLNGSPPAKSSEAQSPVKGAQSPSKSASANTIQPESVQQLSATAAAQCATLISSFETVPMEWKLQRLTPLEIRCFNLPRPKVNRVQSKGGAGAGAKQDEPSKKSGPIPLLHASHFTNSTLAEIYTRLLTLLKPPTFIPSGGSSAAAAAAGTGVGRSPSSKYDFGMARTQAPRQLLPLMLDPLSYIHTMRLLLNPDLLQQFEQDLGESHVTRWILPLLGWSMPLEYVCRLVYQKLFRLIFAPMQHIWNPNCSPSLYPELRFIMFCIHFLAEASHRFIVPILRSKLQEVHLEAPYKRYIKYMLCIVEEIIPSVHQFGVLVRSAAGGEELYRSYLQVIRVICQLQSFQPFTVSRAQQEQDASSDSLPLEAILTQALQLIYLHDHSPYLWGLLYGSDDRTTRSLLLGDLLPLSDVLMSQVPSSDVEFHELQYYFQTLSEFYQVTSDVQHALFKKPLTELQQQFLPYPTFDTQSNQPLQQAQSKKENDILRLMNVTKSYWIGIMDAIPNAPPTALSLPEWMRLTPTPPVPRFIYPTLNGTSYGTLSEVLPFTLAIYHERVYTEYAHLAVELQNLFPPTIIAKEFLHESRGGGGRGGGRGVSTDFEMSSSSIASTIAIVSTPSTERAANHRHAFLNNWLNRHAITRQWRRKGGGATGGKTPRRVERTIKQNESEEDGDGDDDGPEPVYDDDDDDDEGEADQDQGEEDEGAEDEDGADPFNQFPNPTTPTTPTPTLLPRKPAMPATPPPSVVPRQQSATAAALASISSLGLPFKQPTVTPLPLPIKPSSPLPVKPSSPLPGKPISPLPGKPSSPLPPKASISPAPKSPTPTPVPVKSTTAPLPGKPWTPQHSATIATSSTTAAKPSSVSSGVKMPTPARPSQVDDDEFAVEAPSGTPDFQLSEIDSDINLSD